MDPSDVGGIFINPQTRNLPSLAFAFNKECHERFRDRQKAKEKLISAREFGVHYETVLRRNLPV